MKSRRLWKSKIAFFLSVSMLLNLCSPGLVMAEPVYGAQAGSIASDSNAMPEEPGNPGDEPIIPDEDPFIPEDDLILDEDEELIDDATPSELENETFVVSYAVTPEEAAQFKKQPETVEQGENLIFTVKPSDGWIFESVTANGAELEGKKTWFGFGQSYRFQVNDVEEDQYIEVVMTKEDQTLQELSQTYNGVTVTVKELEAGALEGITGIRVSDTDAYTEDVQAQIQASLENGETIAHHAAYDIALIGTDEQGHEVEAEPGDKVSVTISGISPDEDVDYHRINIYHLSEKRQANMAMAMPGVLSDEAVSETAPAYEVETVATNTKEEVEIADSVTFVADAFSPYVVIFVKNPTTDKSVNVYLKDVDGTDLQWDAMKDSYPIGIEDETLTIQSLVTQYGMVEFYPTAPADKTGIMYVFQHASSDEDGNESITEFTYDTLPENVYLWYEPIGEGKVDVYVNLTDRDPLGKNPIKTTISTGNITNEKVIEVLNNADIADKIGDTVYAVEGVELLQNYQKWVDNKDNEDQNSELFKGVKSLGSVKFIEKIADVDKTSIKVTLENGEVVTFNPDDGVGSAEDDDNIYTINLIYSAGVKVHVDVISLEGGNRPGNTVAGETYKPSFDLFFAGGEDAVIPITIDQGCEIEITGDYQYDSTKDPDLVTQLRNYNVIFEKINKNKSIQIKFTAPEKIFDYSDFVATNPGDGHHSNEDGGNGTYHGLSLAKDGELIIDRDDIGEQDSTLTKLISGNTMTLVMKVTSDDSRQSSEYVLNELAINGTNLNIPVDPANDGDETTIEPTIIKDANDEAMAKVTIRVQKQKHPESGDFIIGRFSQRVYTFEFTDIKGKLKVTGGNCRGEGNAELRYMSLDAPGIASVERQIGRGNYVKYDSNDDLFDAVSRNDNVSVRALADAGYYISGIHLAKDSEDYEPQTLSGEWDGQRSTSFTIGRERDNRLSVEAKPISYKFAYHMDNADPNNIEYSEPFELISPDSVSTALAKTAVSVEGQSFQGWKLDKDSEVYYQNGLGIQRNRILGKAENNGEAEGEKIISLYPHYVSSGTGEMYNVKVEFYYADKVEAYKEAVTLQLAKDSQVSLDTITTNSSDAVSIITRLREEGYTKVDNVKVQTLDNTFDLGTELNFKLTEDNIVIKITYDTHPVSVEIQVDSQNEGKGTYSFKTPEAPNYDDVPDDMEFMPNAKQPVELKIDSKKSNNGTGGWILESLEIVDTETGRREKAAINYPDDFDENKSYVYSLDVGLEGNRIIVTFAEDNNDNRIPDDIEATITYDPGDAGNAATGMPSPLTIVVAQGAEQTLPANPAWVGHIFAGWTSDPAVTVTDGKFTVPVGTTEITFTAQWSVDPDAEYYDVTFNAKGGSNVEAIIDQLEGTDVNLAGKTSKKEKAIFQGWTLNADVPELLTTKDQLTQYPIVAEIPAIAENTTVYAVWAVDENGNGTLDWDEYVALTFQSEKGFEGSEGTEVKLENQVPGLEFPQAPVPKDTKDDKVVFTGWTPALPNTVPETGVTYVAQYKADENNDGKPDEDEYVTLTFQSEKGFEGSEGTEVKLENRVPGLEFPKAPVPKDTKDDKVVFTGWTPALPNTVPEANTTYVAQYKADGNNNGKPDEDEYVTLTFQSEKGFEGSEGTEVKLENQVPGLEFPKAPAPKDTKDDKVVFTGWTPALPNTVPETGATYVAQYKADENNNGKPDEDEYVALTFQSEKGFEGSEGTEVKLENQVSGLEFPKAPVPKDTKDDKVVFTGWLPVLPNTVPEADAIYVAQYKTDEDNNGTPDDTQRKLIYDGNGAENADKVPVDGKDYSDGTRAQLVNIDGVLKKSGAVSIGWSLEKKETIYDAEPADGVLTENVTFNGGNITVYAVYAKDENSNEVPDYEDTMYTLHFDAKNGSAVADQKVLSGTAVSLDPKSVVSAKKGALLMGWTSNAGVPELIHSRSEYDNTWKAQISSNILMDADKTVYAVWAADRNENGKPDWEDSSNDSYDSGDSSDSSYTVGTDGYWVHLDPENPANPAANVAIKYDVPVEETPISHPEKHQWKFVLNNGGYVKSRWAYVKNPYATGNQPKEAWFSFDDQGIMYYGWFYDSKAGKWYYMHQVSDGMLGTMITGWHRDEQDGRMYYLLPDTGEMALGWRQIDGKWYYFNPVTPDPTWSQDGESGVWSFSGSENRPYGSMYRNEFTPDGYFVDENGVCQQ